jgi:wyosine [tRNA(Phe)-imidazoG37] synthetase (radical SAM superfamily)
MPSRTAVNDALREKLSAMREKGTAPDVITYAGNGEPTMHPEFRGIIDDSIALRDEFFPSAKISVLSNGSTLHQKTVREALSKVDMNILKLDSAFPDTVKKLNQPRGRYDPEVLARYTGDFNGKFIIQSLFVRGKYHGEVIDNATPAEVDAWLAAIGKLKPQSVMIYTIDRDTPLGNDLKKVPAAELKAIAARVNALGIPASVSG